MPVIEPVDLALYLTRLRQEKGWSLRDVERASEGQVSNVYLSLLENRKRKDPHPKILLALARVYGVPWQMMFEVAGYVDAPETSAVDVAFKQVLADSKFQFGTSFKGALDEAGKRAIIQLYESATGKKLL